MTTLADQILVGEDDRFLRRACAASLRHRGWPVLTAVDGDVQKVVQLGAVGCLAEANLALRELGNRVAQLWGA